MSEKQYAYQHEGRGRGYTIWTIGLSGSRVDCIGHARSRREAQAHVNRLYRKERLYG